MADDMLVPIPKDMAEQLSQAAVRSARERMRGFGWSDRSLESLDSMAADGVVGIRTTLKFLMHQERGIKPFIMWWVEGRKIPIRDASGTMTYTCLVYGDADGDGRIAATDLLAVKMHILNMKTLTGASARALTFSGDGKIAATSLLAIKKHILGMGAITQK